MGEVVNMATAMPLSRSDTGERIIDTFTKVRGTEYIVYNLLAGNFARGEETLLVQLQFNYPWYVNGMCASWCLCVCMICDGLHVSSPPLQTMVLGLTRVTSNQK